MLGTMTEASIGLVLDCADPDIMASFWSAALGYEVLGAAGAYVLLRAPSATKPKLLLQRVSEPKVAKNRMHLDIDTPDIHSEAARLEALGARRIEPEPRSEFGTSWIVMADPEGNEFCVCDASSTGV
jgi:predicted enzyme related to lactoylglutathione lyase